MKAISKLSVYFIALFPRHWFASLYGTDILMHLNVNSSRVWELTGLYSNMQIVSRYPYNIACKTLSDPGHISL